MPRQTRRLIRRPIATASASTRSQFDPRHLLDANSYIGYTLARMRYEIVFAPEAVRDVRNLRAHVRSMVHDAIETCLRHAPEAVSKSRIKRLKGVARPQFRLRVGEVRVYYDVRESTVEILAVVEKSEADEWLKREGGAA